ncbi:MAG: DUF4297 domain-containing protein [Daejeonella sp.]|uniref:DUF4297 domain-containing protein n=1 Tax=Daejeonella sp. TaxID=2805397 RepID=UPI003C78FB99
MTLKDRIVNTKPREKSGSTSASRFDFQKDWSICKLIESHQTSKDYVVIFDWHEDLIIMDSENDPTKVSFYQIKGKKSDNWTLKQLIDSKTAKDGSSLLSIIGKLYDCKSKFDLEVTSLNFVSNARFSVGLADKSTSKAKNEICIVELSDTDKATLTAKIKSEHKLTSDPIYEDITFLKVLDLSLDGSKTHTQGKIADFLEFLKPGGKFNIPSVYRMLFDEVRRRTNYNTEIIAYHDLLANKAIGKSQFEKIIYATGINKDYDEIWIRIEPILTSNGMKFQEIKNLKQAWSKLELEKMNPNNDFLFKIIDNIEAITKEQEGNGTLTSFNLQESIESIYNAFNDAKSILLSYNVSFIKAIILSEIYE